MNISTANQGTERDRDFNIREIRLFNTTDGFLPLDESNLQECVDCIETFEDVEFAMVEAVFVDETEIRRINREYLDHDYVTDIITFPYHNAAEDLPSLEGTLYCCRDRVVEQAKQHREEQQIECCRIIIHGLLHLAGYSDESETKKQRMTDRENFYLSKLGFSTEQ